MIDYFAFEDLSRNIQYLTAYKMIEEHGGVLIQNESFAKRPKELQFNRQNNMEETIERSYSVYANNVLKSSHVEVKSTHYHERLCIENGEQGLSITSESQVEKFPRLSRPIFALTSFGIGEYNYLIQLIKAKKKFFTAGYLNASYLRFLGIHNTSLEIEWKNRRKGQGILRMVQKTPFGKRFFPVELAYDHAQKRLDSVYFPMRQVRLERANPFPVRLQTHDEKITAQGPTLAYDNLSHKRLSRGTAQVVKLGRPEVPCLLYLDFMVSVETMIRHVGLRHELASFFLDRGLGFVFINELIGRVSNFSTIKYRFSEAAGLLQKLVVDKRINAVVCAHDSAWFMIHALEKLRIRSLPIVFFRPPWENKTFPIVASYWRQAFLGWPAKPALEKSREMQNLFQIHEDASGIKSVGLKALADYLASFQDAKPGENMDKLLNALPRPLLGPF